jgi:hypothetical protein
MHLLYMYMCAWLCLSVYHVCYVCTRVHMMYVCLYRVYMHVCVCACVCVCECVHVHTNVIS